MLSITRFLGIGALGGLVFLTGCTAPMSWRPIASSHGDAQARLAQAALAHGAQRFHALHDVSVAYEGTWHNGVERMQPKLVDVAFRKRSEERLLLKDGWAIGQLHFGPGGIKQVVRRDGKTDVRYNGLRDADSESRDAASSVADAYALFLAAPFYLMERGAKLAMAESTQVDGRACDQVLAVLKPGLGAAGEDRVLVAIDRESHLVRRVRFTFEGLASTRGVVADVYLREHQSIDGVIWPTSFEEIVRRPINVMVHRWRMIGLDTNRGLTSDDLNTSRFSDRAAKPARPLAYEVVRR